MKPMAVLSCSVALGMAAGCSGSTGETATTSPVATPSQAANGPAAHTEVFLGSFDDEPVRLTLNFAADGVTVSGRLEGLDAPAALQGRSEDGILKGRILAEDSAVPVFGRISGEGLDLELGPPADVAGESVTLRLRRAAPAESVARASVGPAQQAGSTSVVNGQPVAADLRASLFETYGLQIGAGRFWYDPTSGAWGLEGGPTIGYIVPGLELGGPLRADASGGGTPVAVNGRILHPYDLAALQMLLGPVAPGRYFLDAQGNLGIVGGPALVNLVAMVSILQQQQRQALFGPGAGGAPGSNGGGDNFWSSGITGAAGNESGGAGYVMVDGVSASYGM